MYSTHTASQTKTSYDSVPLKKLQTTLRNEKTAYKRLQMRL